MNNGTVHTDQDTCKRNSQSAQRRSVRWFVFRLPCGYAESGACGNVPAGGRSDWPSVPLPARILDGDRIAQAEGITPVVEEILLSSPEADAAMLVSKNDYHRKAARDMLGEMVARQLTDKYEIARRDRSKEHLRARHSDGQWW